MDAARWKVKAALDSLMRQILSIAWKSEFATRLMQLLNRYADFGAFKQLF